MSLEHITMGTDNPYDVRDLVLNETKLKKIKQQKKKEKREGERKEK